MLQSLRDWLTAVVSVTLLLSLLRVLTPPGAVRSTASFAGGLALASVLLRPLAANRGLFSGWAPTEYRAAVQAEERDGLRQWTEALSAEVCARTEEAVRRKAAELGRLRQVRVAVRADTGTDAGTVTGADAGTVPGVYTGTENGGVPLPWTVTLSGERDAALEAWIADALGIPRERQVWTGGGPPD